MNNEERCRLQIQVCVLFAVCEKVEVCMCVFTKLLLRSLKWMPGEEKLDATIAQGTFQTFPTFRDLGLGHTWNMSSTNALPEG